MRSFIRSAVSDLYASLSGAGALVRLIREWDLPRFDPHIGRPSVDSESVIRWDELGKYKAGAVMGWGAKDGRYACVARPVPALSSLGYRIDLRSWTCDLQDVIGLAASKSRLADYESLDQMIEANGQGLLKDLSEGRIEELLAHSGVRVGRPGAHDYLSLNLTDGRLMLMNVDGSHHFAAARYVAARLQRNRPIVAPLRAYGLDEDAVDALRKEFEMIVIPGDPSFVNLFHNALQSFGATYFALDLPRPYRRDQGRVILLPRDEAKSERVAQACKEGGLFDLSEHLDILMAVQRGNAERIAMPHVPPFFEDEADDPDLEDRPSPRAM